MTFKQKLYNRCIEQLNEKIQFLESNLLTLTQGAQNDTKSSAGDKHETARAMMQIEQDKISRQLNDALQMKAELDKINPLHISQKISKGSLVKTNRGYLYLSVAIGKVVLDSIHVIVLSQHSPLGIKLLGLAKGSSLEINELNYTIEELT